MASARVRVVCTCVHVRVCAYLMCMRCGGRSDCSRPRAVPTRPLGSEALGHRHRNTSQSALWACALWVWALRILTKYTASSGLTRHSSWFLSQHRMMCTPSARLCAPSLTTRATTTEVHTSRPPPARGWARTRRSSSRPSKAPCRRKSARQCGKVLRQPPRSAHPPPARGSRCTDH